MPFSPIAVNSQTFNQAGSGRYMLSTVTFGAPLNYVNVKGGALNPKSGITTGSVSRVVQKDVTVDGKTVRQQLSIQLIVQTQSGFTAAEIDAGTSDLNGLVDATFINRWLNGES